MRTLVGSLMLMFLLCLCPARELAAATQSIAISEHGQIAGWIWGGGGSPQHVFLWERGVFRDLDPEGLWGPPALWYGMDVNNKGQVAGPGSPRANPQVLRPLLFDRGQITDLMGSRPGEGVVAGINNRGAVVGIFADESTPVYIHGFLWEGGQWTDLGATGADPNEPRPQFAWGLALNDRGDVVAVDPGLISSSLWSRGLKTPLDFVVTGINQQRQIVGNSANYGYGEVFASSSRAYLWEDGSRVDLGTLGGDWSFASAINDKGQVAGMSLTAAGEYHAFLWEDGEMLDLGAGSGGSAHLVVEGINAIGQVVGHDAFLQGTGWLWDRDSRVSFEGGVGASVLSAAIDNQGRVAFSTLAGSFLQSYLWSDGEITPLEPAAATAVGSDEFLAAGGTVPAMSAGSVSLTIASANPSSGPARLRYAIPHLGRVTVEVFDVRGVRVRSLVDEEQAAGSHAVTWDGADASGRAVAPGLYFTRLRVGAESRVVRLIRER